MTISLRLLALALLTGSALGLTDCRKNNEPEPPKPSQREIWLTTPGWNTQRIVNVQTTPAGVVTTTDIPLSGFDPCYLDDLNHFNIDRTFTVDDGPLKCQQLAPSSTWHFAANETEIVMGTATQGSHIVALTATSLVLASTTTEPDGTIFVQTWTYAAR